MNLLVYLPSLRIQIKDQKRYVYDPIRKKWVVLQPEEMVRQLVLQYLLQEKAYNRNRIAVERGIKVNGLAKRCDILLFNQEMQAQVIIECKAPEIPLDADVFHQMAMYNLPLQVPYLMMCNGQSSYICQIDVEKQKYTLLEDLP